MYSRNKKMINQTSNNLTIQYLREAINDGLWNISSITTQNQTLHVVFVDKCSISRIDIENNYNFETRQK